jgi:hypothetical protein
MQYETNTPKGYGRVNHMQIITLIRDMEETIICKLYRRIYPYNEDN